MAGPFYNAIKGTTAGIPALLAFTPNAASSGFLAWSTVPTGWWGLVRFEDGSAWELQYSYWNGTTLSRSATAQFVSGSTGMALVLTISATAAMVADANKISPHLNVPWRGFTPNQGAATITTIGYVAGTLTGATALSAIAATNYLTEQPRIQLTSVTTINGQAGVSSVTPVAISKNVAGRGGWEFTCRFGASQLPTAPRVFIGMTTGNFVGITLEPSAATGLSAALIAKDQADTNLQFMTNNGSGNHNKIDTGIALVATGWYEATIWTNPGSLTAFCLLVRLDTGAIYYGSTSTKPPANDTLLFPQALIGLNGTNTGTAAVVHFGGMIIRTGPV